jgi:hypothetical protein
MRTEIFLRKSLQASHPDLKIRTVFYVDGNVYGVFGNNKKWLGCIIMKGDGSFEFIH